MSKIGLDVSLRSTGCCFIGNTIDFKLIQRKEIGVELCINLTNEILGFIDKHYHENIECINLEGLSYNGISSYKDLICGSYWYLKCEITKEFPGLLINEIPVLSWRNPLFTKDELKSMREASREVKILKKELIYHTKNERKKILEEKKDLIDLSSIKLQTFLKLPDNIKDQIYKITENDGRWDLSDSYFIANH